MPRDQEVIDLTNRLNAATDEVAKDLTDLRTKLQDEGVSAATLQPLGDAIARLETLGADPENPIPPAPPA